MTYATKNFELTDEALLQWLDPSRLAYIKATTVGEARKLGVVPPGLKAEDDTALYVLCDADGQALGFAEAWASAYGVAVRNDLMLLSVH